MAEGGTMTRPASKTRNAATGWRALYFTDRGTVWGVTSWPTERACRANIARFLGEFGPFVEGGGDPGEPMDFLGCLIPLREVRRLAIPLPEPRFHTPE